MTPDPTAVTLLTLGGIFLCGLVADLVGRRTRLPRVTLLLLLGMVVGPIGMDLFPDSTRAWFPFVTDLALVMVAFLLGGELTADLLRERGRSVLIVSFVAVVGTAVVVAGGLLALGWSPAVALLLGAVSTSTDPVAVSDVVHESGARGPVTSTLLGIVAVDDAWGIVAMSVALAFVLGMQSPEAARVAMAHGVFEIGGALLVGCAVGVPMALLTGRVRSGEPTQAEALGGILLCGGVARALGVPFLLAAMTMGVVVANLARHHRRPFRAIEGIEWPFMILFLVLSGASLEPGAVSSVLGLTGAYLVLRTGGRLLSGEIGARLPAGEARLRPIGGALLPQAGIALGMALVLSQRVPEVGREILAATVAGTVVFELVGPVATRIVLKRAGETQVG